jgi:hypothetical protein
MSTLKPLTLMRTETAESIEALIASIQFPKSAARQRTRLVCRWEQDTQTGKFFCRWAPEPYRQN